MFCRKFLELIYVVNSSVLTITTQGYVAAVFFLVTGGITLMFNIAYGFTTPQGMPLDVLDSLISSIQFVSCVILMGCYVSFSDII